MSADVDFRVLLTGEFSTMASSWTEHLCLQKSGGQVVLSSCGYEVLARVSEFGVEDEDGEVEYKIPGTIGDKTVVGIEDGEYVVGGDLVPHDDDAKIMLQVGDVEMAREWLEGREWQTQPGSENAWEQICLALTGSDRTL